jgi:hypothetical protein
MAYKENTSVSIQKEKQKKIELFYFSGPAADWTELISHCVRCSRKARNYLAEEVLFKYPNRFQEYLIDCTSAEVRRMKKRIYNTKKIILDS